MTNANAFSIQREGNIYKLFLNKMNYRADMYTFFIKSNILSFVFVDTETDELCFHSKTVVTLIDVLKKQKCKLTEKQLLCMIQSLSYQIHWFEKNNLTFLGWNINDIIVIDNFYFCIANNHFLQPFRFEVITLLSPYEKPYFSSPEIANINKLPATLHYKSCYYSLASLIVYCMLGETLLKDNIVPTKERIDDILKPIYLSKMYWFLLRCLHNNVKDRLLLYT